MHDRRVGLALKSIAANVRRLRLERGLTQDALAERADLEPRYVQRLETGATNPSAKILVRLAIALEADAGAFFVPAKLAVRAVGRPKSAAPIRG